MSILQSKFFGKGAEVDGVLYAFHSNITTVNSTFAENHMHAPDGPFLINDLQHWTLCFNFSYFNSSTHSITELQEAQIPTNLLKSFFYGGVIALFHSNATITGSKFRNNTSENGGALAISKSVTMILNCDFEENTATQFGGALKIGAAHVTINNSRVYSCHADRGGVMDVIRSSVNISSCEFGYNSASKPGGVIRLDEVSQLNVSGSQFVYNVAESGGVLSAVRSNLILRDVLFSKNRAKEVGGVMYASQSLITFSGT